MPQEIISVQCVQCKKLHPKTGAYLMIDEISIHEKVSDDAERYRKEHFQLKKQKDVIVCNSYCLATLLEFKGF